MGTPKGMPLPDADWIRQCERTGYPNPLPKAEYKTCCVCGENIYIGLDDYYDFDGNIVCEDCEFDYVWEHYRRCG